MAEIIGKASADRKNPSPVPFLASRNPLKIANKTKLALQLSHPLLRPPMVRLLDLAQEVRKQVRLQIQR